MDPSVTRRKLRMELRRARERAGLTQREAARTLDWSPSKVIRIETGQVGVSVTDARALAHLYGVTEQQQVDELVEAARESRKSSWWAKYHDVLSASFGQYLGLEGAANGVSVYHPVVVPGHVQTCGYAEALLAPRVEPARAARLARLRAERQEHMLDSGGTAGLSFVIDEAALRRRIGGPEVMRGQLDRLLEVAEFPRVDLMVLPLDFGAHYSTMGGFVLLGFSDDADLLYLEHATGSVTTGNDLSLLARYQECFEALTAGALHGQDACALIERAKGEIGRS
ncbi:putative DNA-binding protein [Actinacidiphila reveromycinica]|uniref:Putative DNA-binding protein n=1 Tax=Actinacidiphila reveromycinica TaxID=659352 RepID=A0A7U3UPE2_9ACTN|nr:putative DNA-binding protein [Streptomyces sp. SN-593]